MVQRSSFFHFPCGFRVPNEAAMTGKAAQRLIREQFLIENPPEHGCFMKECYDARLNTKYRDSILER